jgi:hypothetical protein
MASTSENKRAQHGRARRRASVLLGVIATVFGCRAGLPPEPPGRDAADAGAEVPSYVSAPNPLSTSAFAGEQLREGGHAHHHGHHGGHAKPPEAQTTPPASTEPRHDHSGHGKADETQPEPPHASHSENRR